MVAVTGDDDAQVIRRGHPGLEPGRQAGPWFGAIRARARAAAACDPRCGSR
jgi:hypothetical protein